MKKIKLYLVIDDVDYVQVFTDEDEAWEYAGEEMFVQEAEITITL